MSPSSTFAKDSDPISADWGKDGSLSTRRLFCMLLGILVGVHRARVECANSSGHCQTLHCRQKFFSCENSQSTMRLIPCWQFFFADCDVLSTSFHRCMFGGKGRKYTRLIHNVSVFAHLRSFQQRSMFTPLKHGLQGWATSNILYIHENLQGLVSPLLESVY